MNDDEVYRLIGPVDITGVLSHWDQLKFFLANPAGDRNDPKKMPCRIVLQGSFPPVVKAVLDEVTGLLGGAVGRAVLRQLDPHQGIPPHIDAWMPKELNWRRFQLPLITHPEIKMQWPDDNVSVHLEAGHLYEVRYDRTHQVVNPVPVSRTHLQIDQVDATI